MDADPFAEQLAYIRLLSSQLAKADASSDAIGAVLATCQNSLHALLVPPSPEGADPSSERAPDTDAVNEDGDSDEDGDDDGLNGDSDNSGAAGGADADGDDENADDLREYSEDSNLCDMAGDDEPDSDPFSGASPPPPDTALPAVDDLFGAPRLP
eukprot:2982042-Prymnesium_polylepis.1